VIGGSTERLQQTLSRQQDDGALVALRYGQWKAVF